jgi:hypothetical protein
MRNGSLDRCVSPAGKHLILIWRAVGFVVVVTDGRTETRYEQAESAMVQIISVQQTSVDQCVLWRVKLLDLLLT